MVTASTSIVTRIGAGAFFGSTELAVKNGISTFLYPLGGAFGIAFLGILGSEAGNMVLQVLATGGVYLGGGIPPRILPQLRGETFLRAFTRKGRFSDLLGRVQVEVIVDPRSALHGAANFGLLMAAAENA